MTYEFHVEKTTRELLQWIGQWFRENGRDCRAVVGISGGKDSSVAAALCAEALGRERVLGVLMPDGEQPDMDASRQLVEFLQIESLVVNVHDACVGVLSEVQKNLKTVSLQAQINLPPRIRMATLYAVSQSVNGRVVNTCNLSEDWVGYSTRYGDGAGDFSPMGGLTVAEVKEIGRYLKLPPELVDKVPSDGLCGKSDEDNLGFSYDTLDRYIRTGVCEDQEIKARIDGLHRANGFKLEPMPVFWPGQETVEKNHWVR